MLDVPEGYDINPKVFRKIIFKACNIIAYTSTHKTVEKNKHTSDSQLLIDLEELKQKRIELKKEFRL